MSVHGSTLVPLGTAMIDRPILETLVILWEGPVSPIHLARIELGIRAFLTSQRLVASQLKSAWDRADDIIFRNPYEYEPPFRDHLLDYEFLQLDVPLEAPDLPPPESSYLTEFVLRKMEDEVRRILPKWLRVEGQAYEFLDAWYMGHSLPKCEAKARDPIMWSDLRNPFNLEEFIASGTHAVLQLGPSHSAEHFIRYHRAGLILYTDSPLGNICNEFIFSEWPKKLFEQLDQEYRDATRQIRGPGIAIELPPLTALLLSRSAHRDDIPSTLRELREEYEAERNNLWCILREMWEAPSFASQIRQLKKLEGAAKSIFSAAFPERFNILSLGLDLAPMSAGGVARAGQKLLEKDSPKSRVSAVSFAAKLSKGLRKTLMSARNLLQRHLTLSELKDFGIG